MNALILKHLSLPVNQGRFEQIRKHFNLVTSMGSNKNSFFLYPKTKGLAEDHIGELAYARYSIFRPAFLYCDRAEPRAMERVLHFVFTPAAKFTPTWLTTPTAVVGKAMIANLFKAPLIDGEREVFENKGIHQLAKEFDECLAAKKE